MKEVTVTTTVKDGEFNRVIERREFLRSIFGPDAYAAACSYARDIMKRFPDKTSIVCAGAPGL